MAAEGGVAALKDAAALMVAEPSTNADVVAARLEGRWPAFTLGRDKVQVVLDAARDPLSFRDRTLLAVPPDDVVRIVSIRNGASQTVLRESDGRWAPAPGQTGRVDEAAVADILFATADLRAVSLENRDMGQKAAYGLEPPSAVLTLGLAGEAGIRKTVYLGFRARTVGLYAMIQGHDVVFVLDPSTADALSRNLFVTEPPGETPPTSDQESAD
jgi:hypothetical protein